ncbi:putative arsenite methyltransferase [Helianthus annuus]|nr:putative arsenite methyltransferase [Helianthus annuus]KAJ0865728.1 putative arsenite methyltransferase [Helianthus annuus]
MFLHRDAKLMPRNQTAWSAWNFRETVDNKVCLTYWLNAIQNIDDNGLPFLVTINFPRTPESTVLKWSTGYLVPSLAASKASRELHTIQGKRNIVFCGAYQGILTYATNLHFYQQMSFKFYLLMQPCYIVTFCYQFIQYFTYFEGSRFPLEI